MSGDGLQVFVDDCIRILSDDAVSHHAVVKRHEEDGVLWAVFVAVNDEEVSHRQPSVRMKKSSFLKLSTIQSSKAQSLIQMYNTCNHHTQFVCWFTLEDVNGKPMASKVMLVDASQSSQQHSTRRPSSTVGASTHTSTTAATAQQHSDPLEHLKNDMLSFQRQQKQQATHLHSGSDGAGGMGEERDSYLASLEQGSRNGTPGRRARASSSSATTTNRQQQGSGDLGTGGGGSPQQQYQQILRVSLQVADSVSKMGSTIDELTARLDHMQRQIDARPIQPPGLNDALMERITSLEEKNAALEDRVASFDKIQESFFAQVSSLRQFQESFAAGHHRPVVSGGVRGGVGGYSAHHEGGTSEEVLISNGRFAMSVKESSSPRSQALMDAVASDDGVGSSVMMGASTPKTTTFTTTTNSPMRTPRGPNFGGARSTSARSSGGVDNNSSLSSMLASMEQRLSRIKTPK